ncbi:MAG: hypothetical protein ACLQDV_24945 [Candidatus Binataceae bacterium]
MKQSKSNDAVRKELEDIRTKLLESHTPEEVQLMKLKFDALKGLRLDDGHDHDLDTDSHHDHEHTY